MHVSTFKMIKCEFVEEYQVNAPILVLIIKIRVHSIHLEMRASHYYGIGLQCWIE